MSNKYEELSHERKRLQSLGLAPDWYSTASYQLLVNKNYLDVAETPKDMYNRIAERAAELTKASLPDSFGYTSWKEAFFDIMWKGWLSPSTPVLTNMGNDRGHPISCSGTHVDDSIRSFESALTELAQLTQRGYGCSVSIDSIRRRGSPISKGGKANGPYDFAEDVVHKMKKISQGSSRRGSSGQYINVMNPDIDELFDQLIADDDGWNMGWMITDEYKELFKKDLNEATRLWKRMLKVKMTKGKGYFLFLDKINKNRPQMYIDKGFKVKHSNLCAEITLYNDKDHSFTCVLSSMNISKYDEWKDTKAIQIATIFLDAVIEDMLIKAKKEEGFERVVAFTEKSRAIGLGVLGLSSYYQQQSWIYGDLNTIAFNKKFFKHLIDEALIASKFLAKEVGEPEWMKGYGERFSHLIALPPTKSTAIIQGGISEGINPVFANVFKQDTAGGTIYRINPILLPIMKERNAYNKETMKRIEKSQGSVQGEDWLSEHEKEVFKTAFELNQETVLLMGSHRQEAMGQRAQGQSLNLFYPMEATEEEISRHHSIAFEDPHIHSLYYIHSLNKESKNKVNRNECVACEG
jgi:ribonucleoside-diphosphate reductase alpha chain